MKESEKIQEEIKKLQRKRVHEMLREAGYVRAYDTLEATECGIFSYYTKEHIDVIVDKFNGNIGEPMYGYFEYISQHDIQCVNHEPIPWKEFEYVWYRFEISPRELNGIYKIIDRDTDVISGLRKHFREEFKEEINKLTE